MRERENHPTAEQLADFDTGRLAPEERQAVERHVALCPACCRTLEAVPEDGLVALLRASATETAAEVPAALVGHPRYRVLGVIGAGGMGVVYKAVHQHLGRVVALKVIHPHLLARPGLVERFEREARALARLRHPHIALAHDADHIGDLHFLVLEHVEGPSLDRVVQDRGPLPVREACEYIRQVAVGLEHAHEHGLVHRDVKPQNLLLTDQGQVKIIDFGLAHLAGAEDERVTPVSAPPLLGTPDYAAPEQARGPASVDARADLYGLGATLYYLLSGRPPFPGGTALEKLLAHQERPPQPIEELRPDVPPRLAALLARQLAKEPRHRPTTAAEVAGELSAVLAGSAGLPARPRRRFAVLAAALLLLTGALAVAALAWRGNRNAPEVVKSATTGSGGPPTAAREANLLGAGEIFARRKDARDRALGWLRQNNRWGADATLVRQAALEIDGWLARMSGFQLEVGPRLLKSGKPTIIAVHRGDFFLFELTPEQAPSLRLADSARKLYPYRKGGELVRAPASFALSDLRIDRADDLPRGRRITGTVAYRALGKGGGDLQLRLYYYPRPGRVLCMGIWYPRQELRPEGGTLTFDFPPPNEQARHERLLVGFVELASGLVGDGAVESNTLATLLRLAPGEGP
jgi:hypothetical protein